MRGVVTSYDRKKCEGIITTSDGTEYSFKKYDLFTAFKPGIEDIVTFEIDEDGNAVKVEPYVSKALVKFTLKKEGLRLSPAKDMLGNRRYMIVNDEDWKQNYERYYTLSEAAEYAGLTVD